MVKDTAEPTAEEGAALRPDVLTLNRAEGKLREVAALLHAKRVEITTDLTLKSWPFAMLIEYHAARTIELETWASLWEVVTTGGATDAAWGKALSCAMEWATSNAGTPGAEEGVRNERQRATKRWIRHQRRSWAALPTEVLARAPFEF